MEEFKKTINIILELVLIVDEDIAENGLNEKNKLRKSVLSDMWEDLTHQLIGLEAEEE